MLFVTLMLIGCQTQGWSSAEDCSALTAGTDKDNCWSEHIIEVFKEDPARGIEVVESQVGDSRVQDFIWLKVTREYDPGSYKYCERIQEDALEERCRVLVSRPHLHRELLREQSPPAGSGANGTPPPPQGTVSPPPAAPE